MTDARSRFQGCLLAGALGDALGAAVEFISWEAIQADYGPGGILEPGRAYGRVGAITDDTQMSLFTAEGLLRAHVRSTAKGICNWHTMIGRSYHRWLLTQGERPAHGEAATIATDGWLYSLQALHSRRAPGTTCLHALRTTPVGMPAANQSKGCGGVMRVAPIGLFASHFSRDRHAGHAFQVAAGAAALTHGHPTGSLAAGAFAATIQLLAHGIPLADAIDGACSLLVAHPEHQETLRAIRAAQELAAADPHADVERLGQGWIAEEALAMSLFVSLVSEDMEAALRRAVNHSGDSDSTGAITGNLLGAQWGVESIPQRWLETLELRDEIRLIADDLFDSASWDFDPLAPQDGRLDEIWNRYPGH